MRITTWNVNGIRAALRKGMPEYLDHLMPDVLMLQEIKAMPEQLPPEWQEPEGWHCAWNPAEKKGYAGTAVWSRTPIEVLGTGIDGADDPQGRVLRLRTGGVQIVCLYQPSGSAGPHRQEAKEAWMAEFAPWAGELAAQDEPVLMGGDMNIAHTERDIWNPGGNKRNSGFLPHERAWFGELLAAGWTDTVRAAMGEEMQGPYSWWSNRGQARSLNRGWRIDYLLANAAAAERVIATDTLREAGITVSDHAPVTIDLS